MCWNIAGLHQHSGSEERAAEASRASLVRPHEADAERRELPDEHSGGGNLSSCKMEPSAMDAELRDICGGHCPGASHTQDLLAGGIKEELSNFGGSPSAVPAFVGLPHAFSVGLAVAA